jgi:Raf kinase inhibitor-like YbhB/YbcL family protein
MLAGMVVAPALVACAASPSMEAPSMPNSITVTSTAFTEGGSIPSRHTCDADDVSPPLAWSNVPEGTAAFALVVDDPDARGWIHWIVADIPAETTMLAEGTASGTEGRNDFRRAGWGGPCPPSGSHRYAFEVFALREPLGLAAGFSPDELRSAMEGRVIGSGRLTASYRREG